MNDLFFIRAQIEADDEYLKWSQEIPYIRFPEDWNVRIVPPFAGAIVRFFVEDLIGDRISVYLDCYDRLGIVGKPYWEAYSIDGDTHRCLMNQTDELLEVIQKEIDRRRSKK